MCDDIFYLVALKVTVFFPCFVMMMIMTSPLTERCGFDGDKRVEASTTDTDMLMPLNEFRIIVIVQFVG